MTGKKMTAKLKVMENREELNHLITDFNKNWDEIIIKPWHRRMVSSVSPSLSFTKVQSPNKTP